MRIPLIITLLLLSIPTVLAVDFVETFEDQAPIGFDATLKPDQDWYNYAEGSDVGNLTLTQPIPYGSVAFRVAKTSAPDPSLIYSQFQLELPAQVTKINFTARGTAPTENSLGSMQVITLESSAPQRKLAEFYVMCNNATYTSACELRVRWLNGDTTGQALILADEAQKQFNVTLTPDWINFQYTLTVNGISAGTFPFLELPINFQRLTISQYRGDIPIKLTFDNWRVNGGIVGNATPVEGDAFEGLALFMYDIHFRSSGSKFIFGVVLFFICMAAVIMPVVSHGKSNAIINGASFYTILLVFGLILWEIWPNWIGITLIIIVSAFIGLILRRYILGIKDANTDVGMIVGSFGYFLIASTFLGFSGYATQTLTIPSSQVDGDGGVSQSFIGAVTECIVTGGAFTFGLIGDCDQSTVSGTWKAITDIFSWVRTAIDFLYQLLTFSLPIPVIFNMMIVLPPAAALAVFGFKMVRGTA